MWRSGAIFATFLAVTAATAAAPAPVTLAALGDSLTAGFGLPVADGFVPQLERWLNAHGQDTVVLNAGVSGDTTAGGLSRLAWTLTPEVQALIVALGANDMLRGIDPAATRANLDAILTQADARGLPVLLIGITSAANYGPDYKTAFDAIYPGLADAHGTLLVPSFLGALEALPGDAATLRQQYLQPDGLHPNAAGVDLIVQTIGPRVVDLIGKVAK